MWFSFLLLTLIKTANKNALTAVISLYMVSLENPEIKILKSQQIQVNLVLNWNYSFQFASYKQCYLKVYQSILIEKLKRNVYFY